MLKTLKPFVYTLALTLTIISLNAQDSADAQKSTDENIIIHKKNAVKDKVTIEINGDSITVNGKPIDDFTSDDIDIVKQKQDLDDAQAYSFGSGSMGPMQPQIKAFHGDMMRTIKSNNAFLGVMTNEASQGAKITEVTKGSAAEKAGLKEGDVISKINEDKISGPDDLYKTIGKHKPNDKITITYLRNEKQLTTSATLAKSDEMKVYSWNTPNDYELKENLNRSLSPYNFSFSWDENKPHLGIAAQDTEDGNGVKIVNIDDDDSPAAKAGLKEDDIITQVNGKTITSTEDLKESVKDLKKGDTVKITYKRNNQTQTVDVKFPKDLKTIDL